MKHCCSHYKLFLLISCFTISFVSTDAQRIFKKSEDQSRPSEKAEHTIYLIGDAGEVVEGKKSAMDILKPLIAEDSNAEVVFLGDNIYPRGLGSKNSEFRERDISRIEAQMEPLKEHEGKVIFIPGNHDWAQGREEGLKNVKRQQKYVEKFLGQDDNFMPDNGCPGPKVEEIGDLTIIAIDTQWWLHSKKKSIGEADGCSVLDPAAFMVEFREALKKNRNKHVLVVGHHPLMSNGEHGGHFTLKDHIFPLTEANEKAYIPLPIVGSIYPFYRSILGDRQDIKHPVYTEMVNAITQAIEEYENVVYAAGHEHSLQYFPFSKNHHIISGSGSKVTHVGNTKQLGFGAERIGLARLSYYENGDVWLEYIAHSDQGENEILFSRKIYNKKPVVLTEKVFEPKSYAGMTKMVVGDSAYHIKGLSKALMGELNRPLWLRPIEVPFLDIHHEKGGLTPIQQGGGLQSKSIRLLGGDGQQYVVRQIKKNATFLVAKQLRNTLAQAAIYDGIAGSHPYASIVIPRLSDPVGVYHANPKLVFLPDDPVLGDLREEFGGTFCLFEERPNKDMSHLSSVGNSKKVVGYGDMVENVHTKKNHRVDEEFALKSRLFDMLIGDWDRHDDQWRWASFKEDGITTYRPIPRDRDQAFFKFDGFLPSIVNRKWVIRKFQKFGPDIRDVKGQNFNARYFDRSWLTQMDRSDWQRMAEFIKSNLSDEDINVAIELFPDTAKNWNGDFLKQSLKSRRDILPEIAESYYKFLAKSVKVVGKTDADFFEVKRLENGNVHVRVSPLKDGKADESRTFFDRVFDRNDTKEIILYGLDGKDLYSITGEVKKSILVRIVGGEEKDQVNDQSHVSGMRKMTRYYDDTSKNDLTAGPETKSSFRPPNDALRYDRKDFVYNTFFPAPYVGFNPDDGVFLGAGISWINHGFDKPGFKTKQSIRFNYAFQTGAYNAEYKGVFRKLVGPFDFGVDLQTHQPFIFRYNGAGNETQIIDLAESRVRLNNILIRPYLAISNKTGASQLQLSLHADNWRFNENEEDELGIPITDDTFIGAGLTYKYENVDDKAAPHRGIRFNASIDHSVGKDNPLADSLFTETPSAVFSASTDIRFTRISSEMSLYFPLDWMPLKTTLALRGGVKHNTGDFNFYQASFIGGQNEFRGTRRNRFAGNTAQYNNAELRMDLRRFKNYTLPFKLGIMGHYDLARVWLENEDSNIWHNSVGGGIYFNILSALTVNATFSVADEEEGILLVQGKFLF